MEDWDMVVEEIVEKIEEKKEMFMEMEDVV